MFNEPMKIEHAQASKLQSEFRLLLLPRIFASFN